MACRVGKLIQHPIKALEDDVDIQRAAAFMSAHDVDSVLVTHRGQVSGLFTERDLVRRVIGPGKSPSSVTLSDVCTRSLISVHDETTCEKALKTMNSNHCRRLLVYHGETLKGVITLPEIAHAMASRHGKTNALINVMGGITVLVTFVVIGFGLYQLPNMARLAMDVIK